MDWSTKSPIVLITNDIEMSYPMALLRHRQFSVILAASSKSPAHEELKLQSSVFLDWDLDILRRNPSPVQRTTIPQALSPTPVSVPQESGSRTDKDEAIASSLPTATIRSSNITAASRLDDTGCSTCQSSPVRQTIRLDSASHSSDSKRSRRPVSSVNTGSSGSSGSGTGWSLSDLDGVNEYELGLHTPPGWPGSLKAPGKLDNRTSTPGTPMGRITQLPTNSSGRTSSQTTSTSVVVEDSIPINWPKTPKGTTTILGYRKFTPSPSIADTSDFVTAATSSSAQSSAGFNPIGSAQTPAKSPAASLSPYAPAYTRLGSQATPPTPPQPFRITTAADWPPPITSTAPEKAWVSITRPTASTSSAASTSTYVPPTSNQDSVDVSAFKPLVARLEELLKKGKDEPGRSIVGEMKADKRVLFEKANVNNYTEYLELAQRLGLIRLGGGKGNSSWVKLMPEWRDIIGSS
ncbi:hypothetical protein AX16_010497 [Volvariella volvacea WC 439]|nr:hypothetical protein AX16_010497 [Volvariella volvacea WC 439]